MKKKFFILQTILLTLSLTSLFAKGGKEELKDDNRVEVRYATYRVGSHVHAALETEVLKEFAEANKETIKLKIEELPSDDSYVSKMKTLAAAKNLPAVVDGKNGIREMAVKNGQAVNLIPLLEEDSQWKATVGEKAIAANLEKDGALYSISPSKMTLGYFYNKDMFKKAGISPAKTWDEFMANNQKLKKAGFTPLAMMTGENSWTTNLFLAAMVGTDGKAGNEFMNTYRPETYSNGPMTEALSMMKTVLKEYSTGDSLGAIYANAANNFCQEQAAMMANGPWMIPDFTNPEKSTEDFSSKVDIAAFPENGILSVYELGYTLCTAGLEENEQAAGLKFMKWMTGSRTQQLALEMGNILPASPLVEISDSFKEKNPLIAKLLDLSKNASYTFKTFDVTANASVVDAFSIYYPELAFDAISPSEMADELSKAAQKNN